MRLWLCSARVHGMQRGGCGACSTQLAASHLKFIFAQHFLMCMLFVLFLLVCGNSSLRCQGMQTPGSSSSAAGGHGGGGDRVGKRGRDGDEDPPNDDARRTVPSTTLFVGEDLSRTGKSGRGHVLCADCNTVHHHLKHCLEKKAARGAHISALLQPKDSAPVHTDSDGVETLQISHIPGCCKQSRVSRRLRSAFELQSSPLEQRSHSTHLESQPQRGQQTPNLVPLCRLRLSCRTRLVCCLATQTCGPENAQLLCDYLRAWPDRSARISISTAFMTQPPFVVLFR